MQHDNQLAAGGVFDDGANIGIIFAIGRGLSQYIFKYWRNMKRYCNVLVLLRRSSILQYLLRLHIAIRYIAITMQCSILQYIATYCYSNHEIHTYIAASY
jgi:hypothetical protein